MCYLIPVVRICVSDCVVSVCVRVVRVFVLLVLLFVFGCVNFRVFALVFSYYEVILNRHLSQYNKNKLQDYLSWKKGIR